MTIQTWDITYTPENLNMTRQSKSNNNEEPPVNINPHAFHRTAQNAFLQDCMRYYKTKLKWKSWIIVIDTDEFITVNNDYYNKHFNNPISTTSTLLSSSNIKNNIMIQKPGSVMKLLQRMQNNGDNNNKDDDKKKNCIPMYRKQMCMDEADPNHNTTLRTIGNNGSGNNSRYSLSTFRVSDFLTHNFIRIEGDRDVKNLINVGRIPESYFHGDQMKLPTNSKLNPIVHNPAPGYCFPSSSSSSHNIRPGKMRVPIEESPFLVYHYTGTDEQRNFRTDVRGNFGKRGGTALPSTEKCKSLPSPNANGDAIMPGSKSSSGGVGGSSVVDDDDDDDDIRSWLQGFIHQVGYQEAARLLNGVGQVHSWPQIQ